MMIRDVLNAMRPNQDASCDFSAQASSPPSVASSQADPGTMRRSRGWDESFLPSTEFTRPRWGKNLG
jgi:hypothetical protein